MAGAAKRDARMEPLPGRMAAWLRRCGGIGMKQRREPAISVRHVFKRSRPKVLLGKRDGESLRRVWRQVWERPAAAAGGVASVASSERAFLDDVSLDIEEGTVVALKGLSGSGRSEFLQALAGVLPIDAGEMRIRGEVGSLLQRDDRLSPELSLREIVARSAARRRRANGDTARLSNSRV